MTGKWTLTLLLFAPPPPPFFQLYQHLLSSGKAFKAICFKLIRPIRLWETMSQRKRYHHSLSPSRHRERSHTTSDGPPKRRRIPDSVPPAAESSLGFNPLFVTSNSKRHSEDQWPGLHHRVSLRTTFGNSPPLHDDQILVLAFSNTELDYSEECVPLATELPTQATQPTHHAIKPSNKTRLREPTEIGDWIPS